MTPRCVTGDALTAQDVYDIWKIRDAVFAVAALFGAAARRVRGRRHPVDFARGDI